MSARSTPPFFILQGKKARTIYFFTALIIVLSLRMLENAIHELSHGVTVILVGGKLPENPFLITPFGGYTEWKDVPQEYLWIVNISGTLVSVLVMIAVFIPIFIKGKRVWMKWIAYWGGFVIPVNALFYWFMAPFIGTANHFDPVAFAYNVGITPTWFMGIIAAFPFGLAVYAMLKKTKDVSDVFLDDPTRFHVKCLVVYYIISITFPVVSYLNLLDAFRWW